MQAIPNTNSVKRPPRRARRAVVLLIVLVAIVVLSLAAYTFKDLMQTNKQAARVHGQQVQTRFLVDSGVEHILQYLRQDETTRLESGGHYDNPLYFQAVMVTPSDDPGEIGSFTVLSPYVAEDGISFGVRYGLEDESSRLNLNMVLLADRVQEGAARELLMTLPNMTEDVADAILDWIDEDDEPREFGAELEYYGALTPAYAPRNGPLQTVEELLLVRGVMPQLLFGADSNRNGMADPHETSLMSGMDAMGGTMGAAPTAGMLGTSGTGTDAMSGGLSFDRGWSAYLTLYSAERNLNAAGEPRIYLNTEDMQQLHDDLAAVFDSSWADFIVAYRIYGPAEDNAEATGGQQSVDLDLSQPPSQEINQVLDLIGAKVEIRAAGGQQGGGSNGQNQDEPLVIESPFSEDVTAMTSYMITLMDNCTVVEGEAIHGRISVNEAAAELLLGIPGITEEIVDAIMNARELVAEEDPTFRSHETWLLTEGLVTLDEMRTLLPFVTAGGDVFRAQVIGYFQNGGPSSRAEIIFDATGSTPRVVFWRDISHLGRGHSRATLGTFSLDL